MQKVCSFFSQRLSASFTKGTCLADWRAYEHTDPDYRRGRVYWITSRRRVAQRRVLRARVRRLMPQVHPQRMRPAYLELKSVYALTKYDQERLCLIAADAYLLDKN